MRTLFTDRDLGGRGEFPVEGECALCLGSEKRPDEHGDQDGNERELVRTAHPAPLVRTPAFLTPNPKPLTRRSRNQEGRAASYMPPNSAGSESPPYRICASDVYHCHVHSNPQLVGGAHPTGAMNRATTSYGNTTTRERERVSIRDSAGRTRASPMDQAPTHCRPARPQGRGTVTPNRFLHDPTS